MSLEIVSKFTSETEFRVPLHQLWKVMGANTECVLGDAANMVDPFERCSSPSSVPTVSFLEGRLLFPIKPHCVERIGHGHYSPPNQRYLL